MKRILLQLLLCTSLITLLCSCGQSSDFENLQKERKELQEQISKMTSDETELQKKYDELLEKNKAVEKSLTELTSTYNNLQAEHDELVKNTSDWLKMSDDEKAAKAAQAEADRIIAEEAQKKAEEERKAAEAAAAEEAAKKAAEEAARKAEEEKKGYNTGITFNDLARNPDDYNGKKVTFTGEVLQVTELTNEVQIRLATKKSSWGGYSDDVVYIYFSSSLIKSRILEDDIITIYGIAKGLHSYTTVLGANVTLPLIEVEKIDYQN